METCSGSLKFRNQIFFQAGLNTLSQRLRLNPNSGKKTSVVPHIIDLIDKEPIELHLHAGSKLGDNLEEPILQQPDTSCLFDRDLTPYYKVFTGGKWHSHYDLIRKSIDPDVN